MRIAGFFPAVCFTAGVLLVSGVREQRSIEPAAPLSTITGSFDGERGSDLQIPLEEQRVAGMSSYVLRSFGADSTPLMTVYVGYYNRQSQGRSIHSPKNCLPGAGWEILSTKQVAVPGRGKTETVNRVVLANRNAKALVYYWYQGRGRIESSEYIVKWDLLRDAAIHGRTEEALVRIVVPLSGVESTRIGATESVLPEADATALRAVKVFSADVDRIMPRLED